MKLLRSSYEIAACTQAALVRSFPRRSAQEGKGRGLRCDATRREPTVHLFRRFAPLRARPDTVPSVAASRATSPDGGRLRGAGRRGRRPLPLPRFVTSFLPFCAGCRYQAGENEHRIPVLAPKAYIRTTRVRERGEKNEFQQNEENRLRRGNPRTADGFHP